MTYRAIWLATSSLLAGTLVPAVAEQASDPQDARRWTVQAGAVKQFKADLDKGEMSVGRYFASISAGRQFSSRWRIAAEFGFGEDNYDFSGNSGFGALRPWDKVRELRVSLPLRYVANQNWTVFAVPTLRSNAESGASLNDGKNGGLLAGATYRVSETLSIGPGFGAFSEIEDSAGFFPILLIDWTITDTLSLETGGGFAASRGPGLQLRWTSSPRWQFALGGRYEKTRFRLDDDGPAPDGVGQDKAFPIIGLAEYTASDDVKLSVVGGVELGGSLRLEDDSGKLVSKSDLDNAPFLGATLQATF